MTSTFENAINFFYGDYIHKTPMFTCLQNKTHQYLIQAIRKSCVSKRWLQSDIFWKV